MDYRFLGTTGLRISSVGLGTMSFGGDADEDTSAEIFARAREAGVNFFDCANLYNGGRSEEILGRLIRDCREDVVISTKAYFPTGTGPNDRGASRYHLRNALEASLRRLGTDRVDLFYIHHFDHETALEETLRTLDDFVRQGKILYPAVSNFAAWQVQRGVDLAKSRGFTAPVAVQPMYNLAKRQAEVEILPMAAANGVAVITYSPLGGGLFSGKYGSTERPPAGRLVDHNVYKVRYGDARYYELAGRFTETARNWGFDPVTLAIAWVKSHPAVTAPLIGARTVAQMEPALAAGSITLTKEQRGELTALSPDPPPATDRNDEQSSHTFGSR